MRRLVLALSMVVAPLVLVATPQAHAASAALHVRYYQNGTLADGGSLNAGTSDQAFEFFLILSSDGDADLEIGAITVPAGISVVSTNPDNSTVAAGATSSL
jgi:hypothetical protein